MPLLHSLRLSAVYTIALINSLFADNNDSFLSTDKIEDFFPQLKEIITGMNQDSLIWSKYKENNLIAAYNKQIADSVRGVKASLNISAQSIHEKRSEQSYYHRYQTVSSFYIKKPIFEWGALNANSRIAELSEKLSLQSTDYSKSLVMVQIKSEFLDLVLLNFELNLARKTLELRVKNEEDIRKRKELGLATDLNVADANIQKLEQSVKVSELERIIQNRTSNFIFDTSYKEILDLNITDKFKTAYLNNEITEKIPILISSLSSYEIDQLKIQIQTENNKIIVAESGKKPKLKMVGGFFQDQIDLADSPDPVRRNNFLIGVEANWNVWDASLSNGQKALAMANKRKFDIELASKIKKLRIEVENLKKQLFNLLSQIKLSRMLVEAASKRFHKSKVELKESRITTTKHFESEISLNNANLNLVRTVFTYIQVKLLYERIINYPKS